MHDYFIAVDSFPRFDTLTEDFQLLKAYYRKDTSYLRRSYNDLIRHLRSWDGFDSTPGCEVPSPIHLLSYEKSFRFSYGAAFCDTSMIMTIGKQKSEIIAETLLYTFDISRTRCVTVKKVRKRLEQQAWDKLQKGIRYADFWGLKGDNDMRGCDGSGLYVLAFEKSVNAFRGRYKVIYRWAAERTAIGTVFKDMMDETGTNVSCFHYNYPEW